MGQGNFEDSFYYIDMELCDLNLETYLYHEQLAEEILLPISNVSQLWSIMQDITNGVAFIHGHKETHRDLKPRNSTPRSRKWTY